MRYGVLLLVLALTACEPPPELTGAGGEPTLTILYPSKANTTPVDLVLLDPGGLEERCALLLTVVVDIDGLDLAPPGSVLEEVEGQGHWHLGIDGATNQVMSGEPFLEAEFTEVSAGETVLFEASLRSNLHQPLVEFDNHNDFVEITAGNDCQ